LLILYDSLAQGISIEDQYVVFFKLEVKLLKGRKTS